MLKDKSIKILKEDNNPFLFSICTLVTRLNEYEEMLDSFIHKGFTRDICEYLHIDNSQSTTYDAYEGLNVFLQKAKGKYVILCHQDILLHDNDINDLKKLIEEITLKDENWAILGNAGGINLKWIATHITQGSGRVLKQEYLPLKTKSVDENFMVVKRDANIALSRNLKGFHFYGTDICLIANVLGYNSYIIEFNLTHKSNGKKDKEFYRLEKALKYKYQKAFSGRYLSTTFSRMYLSGNALGNIILDSGFIKFFIRQYFKYLTSVKNYKI